MKKNGCGARSLSQLYDATSQRTEHPIRQDMHAPPPNPPALPDANVRASSYYVLQATHRCAKCRQDTSVFTLALPPDHDSTEADMELDEDDADHCGLAPADFQDWLFSPPAWQTISGPALLSQVSILSEAVARTLQTLAPTLRQDVTRHGQWTNFCEHCDSAVWEGALYPTPGQPFCPKDDAAAAQMTVHTIDAPFEAYASMIWSDSYRNKWPLFKRLGVECSEAE